MNLAAGLTSSPRIYFEFAVSIFAVQNMGEVMIFIYGNSLHDSSSLKSIGIIFTAFTSSMGLSVS